MKVIKEVKTPQTIIICDAYIDNDSIKSKIMLDDDETNLIIRNNYGTVEYLDSFGHVYVFTKEEFLEYSKSEECLGNGIYGGSNQEGYNQYIVINDFIGTIGVTAILPNEEESDEFSLDNYFYHQTDGKLEDSVLVMTISDNYEIISMGLENALYKIKCNSPSIKEGLTKNEKETIYGGIETEGLGYWCEHYGYKGNNDDKLKNMTKDIKIKIRELKEYLSKLGIDT